MALATSLGKVIDNFGQDVVLKRYPQVTNDFGEFTDGTLESVGTFKAVDINGIGNTLNFLPMMTTTTDAINLVVKPTFSADLTSNSYRYVIEYNSKTYNLTNLTSVPYKAEGTVVKTITLNQEL